MISQDSHTWKAPFVHRDCFLRVPHDTFLALYVEDARDLIQDHRFPNPEPFQLSIAFHASPTTFSSAGGIGNQTDTGVRLMIRNAPYDMIELLPAENGHSAMPDINSASLVRLSRFVHNTLGITERPYKIELGVSFGDGKWMTKISGDLADADIEGVSSAPLLNLLCNMSSHEMLPFSQHPQIAFLRLPKMS
ncbi:hypothetical protein ACOI1H_16340 [Loktanella sp. DJP18]|uniref:hypothetical protein n=1 Tax=Loktanella sp. DJP18 TaxID=3409788 RepID=UPI003BB5F4A8